MAAPWYGQMGTHMHLVTIIPVVTIKVISKQVISVLVVTVAWTIPWAWVRFYIPFGRWEKTGSHTWACCLFPHPHFLLCPPAALWGSSLSNQSKGSSCYLQQGCGRRHMWASEPPGLQCLESLWNVTSQKQCGSQGGPKNETRWQTHTVPSNHFFRIKRSSRIKILSQWLAYL